jgi:diguanylate cyclase (GGDEF)-like protein
MTAQDHLDPATGLYTRETLDFLFGFEMARQRRYPSPLALLRIGVCTENLLDNAGLISEIRMKIAILLNTNLRETDVPAHDGDDFLVLLPETDLTGGKTVSLRLLLRLNDTRLTGSYMEIRPAACIGLTWNAGGQVVATETLFGQAAAALRAAKRRGPFSVVCFEELGKG